MFFELKFLRQFDERWLQPVADDENDFVKARRRVETPPGVRDDRLAGDLEEKLVDVRTHAGAPAGGDNDGGIHGRSLGVAGKVQGWAVPPRPRGLNQFPVKFG